MSQGRSTQQRKADVLATLQRNGDLWLASANGNEPHLIPASGWWDGTQLIIATRDGSRTARNLHQSKVARVGLGAPDDVVMIDVSLVGSAAVAAALDLRAGFKAAMGWDPADEGDDWAFYRLRPTRIQAYRGYW